MPPEPHDTPALEIAHVLFMDIVGYSKLLIDEQARRLRKLQEIVIDTDEFRRAEAGRQLIRLPTGDGMALVFFGDAVAPVRCAMAVSRALRRSPEIELRMGVHSGPVYRVADINANSNVAGAGINYAQRVMDAGGNGHILLSKSVADVLIHLTGWKEHLDDLGEVEVKHGVFIHVFNLHTGECGNPDPPAKKVSPPAAPPAPAAQPNLGPFVHKLCDRNSQVPAFMSFFGANRKANPGRPLFCFIHGDERECHDSLVERLVRVHIDPFAAGVWGEHRGGALLKLVSWPHEGEADERRQQLKWRLFAQFNPAYMDDDVSAKALSRVVAPLLSPVVVIRHNIHGEHWDGEARALVEWYMGYWGELGAGHAGPQFLVFINVIYPKKARAAGRWKLWLQPKPADKKRIQADLEELCAGPLDSGCPRLLLKELAPPQQHEVGDWFSQHNIHDVKTRAELLATIFTGAGPVTMAEVEHNLEKILRDYERKRGA